jgi:hypothetical protein
MQTLVSRAGLSLNPGQMADLVLAWRQVGGLLALIPRDRPMTDDQAYVFRLPPPAATAPGPAPQPARKPTPARKSAKATPRKPAKKPAAPPKAPKKPAARKATRRRR